MFPLSYIHTVREAAPGAALRGQQDLQRGCWDRSLPDLHPGVCQGLVGPLRPDSTHGHRLHHQGVQPGHAQTLLQVKQGIQWDCHVPLAHPPAEHSWPCSITRNSANLTKKLTSHCTRNVHNCTMSCHFKLHLYYFDHNNNCCCCCTKINREFIFYAAKPMIVIIHLIVFTPIIIIVFPIMFIFINN